MGRNLRQDRRRSEDAMEGGDKKETGDDGESFRGKTRPGYWKYLNWMEWSTETWPRTSRTVEGDTPCGFFYLFPLAVHGNERQLKKEHVKHELFCKQRKAQLFTQNPDGAPKVKLGLDIPLYPRVVGIKEPCCQCFKMPALPIKVTHRVGQYPHYYHLHAIVSQHTVRTGLKAKRPVNILWDAVQV